MSAPTNFISRWWRLKGEANSALQAPPDAEGACKPPAELQAASNAARQEPDEVAVESIDEASLPPIDAIARDTDIRAFLRSNLPADLTRAALRKAWTSDPAIRDFIGIAESQWDFNDPNAIPGFGPLQVSDNVPALLEQAVGGGKRVAEAFVDWPVSGEQRLAAVTDLEPADLDRSMQGKRDGVPAGDDVSRERSDTRKEDAAIENRVSAPNAFTKPTRHGSASPRYGSQAINYDLIARRK